MTANTRARAACPTAEAVAAMVRQRAAVGLAKYGTTVADNPLSRRQWLRHAQEEALDLAVYLQRLIDAEPDDNRPPPAGWADGSTT
jgi:homospermidine synthase